MPLRIDDDKLLKKYKTIWTKIEDLQNTKLDALSVYDNAYIKIKIRTNGMKFYTSFRCLDLSKDGVKFKFFTVIFIDSLLVFLLILYCMTRNITCKYIYTTVLLNM